MRYSAFAKGGGFVLVLSLQEKRQVLEQKKKALEMKIRALADRDRAQERKLNDRKKFLIGAYYLERGTKNPDEMKQIVHALDTWLVRDKDRELFGLPTRASGDSNPAVQVETGSSDPAVQVETGSSDPAVQVETGSSDPAVQVEKTTKKWGIL